MIGNKAMLALKLDFKWYKDTKGYRLVPGEPWALRPGQSILDVKSSDIHLAQPRIVRLGGKLKSYQPFETVSRLHTQFIDMAKTETGVLKFVKAFGPLTQEGLRGEGEDVRYVIDQAEEMSEVLRGRIIAMPLNRLIASIETDRNNITSLKVRPACLLDALWLQVAQAKSVSKVRECRQCGEPFRAGRGTDRRADAKFCSPECKTKYFSLKRSR